MTGEHCVEVHLLEVGPPVLHDLAGDHLQLVDHVLDALSPVALDEPDDDIGAALLAPEAFAQHGVGLTHTGGGAQIDPETPGRSQLARERGHHTLAGPLSGLLKERGRDPLVRPGQASTGSSQLDECLVQLEHVDVAAPEEAKLRTVVLTGDERP